MTTAPADLPPAIRALYPFRSRYLALGDARMHYLDEGLGEPLVFLHGNPTWSFYFRELIKGLRGSRRVIAPDHIGCGLSDKPRAYPYTLARHVENFGRLADHLALERVDLAVHDWGGAIGFAWAVANPDRIRRLIVFNTAAFPGPCPFRIRVCRWPVLGRLAVQGLNLFALAALRMATAHPERISPEVRQGLLHPYRRWADRAAIFAFVRDIPLSAETETARLIRTTDQGLSRLADKPMLICWGGRDFCFNDGFLEEWRRRFPRAEVHRFADAGHYVVEDAHEQILPLISRFLSAAR